MLIEHQYSMTHSALDGLTILWWSHHCQSIFHKLPGTVIDNCILEEHEKLRWLKINVNSMTDKPFGNLEFIENLFWNVSTDLLLT